MRTLPQAEIRSLSAPAPQESQAQIQTTNRRDGPNFAETLKRKSAPVERTDRANKDPEPVAKSAEVSDKAPTTTRRRPTDDATHSSDEATTNDNLPVVDVTQVDSPNAPSNPLTLGDLGTALGTNAVESTDLTLVAGPDTAQKPLAGKVTETANATVISVTAANVATSGSQAADATVASTTTDVADATVNLTPKTFTKPATNQTNQPDQLSTAAIASHALSTDDASVDVSSALPNTFTAARGAKPATAASHADDNQINVSATNPSANDNDPRAAILPIFANDMVSKTALPAVKTQLPASSSDDAPMTGATTALPNITPIHSATPATQSSGMNAIAAAIGEKKQDPASDTAQPFETKISNESSLVPLQPGPTAQVTVTRPMSETVLAQSALAANGNSMEKALSHQVSKALIQNMPNGDRVLVMRLTPPELGTVKIEVVERMGVLTAKLHAEDDGVRLALERFLPSMRQDLRASDAPIRELSMSDQTQFQRSFADGQNPQQQQQQNAESSNRRARADEPRFAIDGTRSDTVVASRGAPLGGRVSLSEVNALA